MLDPDPLQMNVGRIENQNINLNLSQEDKD